MEFKDIEGKTIQSAVQCQKPEHDDAGWLLLKFTDGTECVIIGYYGGYTGQSEDEYPTGVDIVESVTGLVPISEPSQ